MLIIFLYLIGAGTAPEFTTVNQILANTVVISEYLYHCKTDSSIFSGNF
ncbi:hypothetical protein [Pseudobutyrivibrio ruminis]|nr:hypothetical protein [Pseudobutyrivibrio ruminis]